MAEARTPIIYTSFGKTMYPKQRHFIVNIAGFPAIFVVTLHTALIRVPVEDICIETFLKFQETCFEVSRSQSITHTVRLL